MAQWAIGIAIAVVAWLLSYFAATSAVNSRLAVLESQVGQLQRDIVEMKAILLERRGRR